MWVCSWVMIVFVMFLFSGVVLFIMLCMLLRLNWLISGCFVRVIVMGGVMKMKVIFWFWIICRNCGRLKWGRVISVEWCMRVRFSSMVML